MSKMYFRLTNQKEFVSAIKGRLSPQNIEQFREIAGASSIKILSNTRRRITDWPAVITGTLRRSFRVFFEQLSQQRVSAGVMTDCEYAPNVEFGGKNRRAKPSLFPAYEQELPNFLKNLRKAWGDILA